MPMKKTSNRLFLCLLLSSISHLQAYTTHSCNVDHAAVLIRHSNKRMEYFLTSFYFLRGLNMNECPKDLITLSLSVDLVSLVSHIRPFSCTISFLARSNRLSLAHNAYDDPSA